MFGNLGAAQHSGLIRVIPPHAILVRQPIKKTIGLGAQALASGAMGFGDDLCGTRWVRAEQEDLLPVGDAAMLVPDIPLLADLPAADETIKRGGPAHDITGVEELAAISHLADARMQRLTQRRGQALQGSDAAGAMREGAREIGVGRLRRRGAAGQCERENRRYFKLAR